MRHSLMVGSVLLCVTGAVAAQNGSSASQSQQPTPTRLIVAQDGSGQFRTIQEALDAISLDNQTLKTIVVKNGTYREKIFIKSSHVAIVGEDRDRTVIAFAELRKNWRVDHADDWGAAVVNIGDTASDIFLGNLTVHNNYGSLHGDHDHQFAIRSGGIATRIIIVHAKIVADGGDTLSLWNTGNGMYYHADCDFEGWVDYVCPRGWCYITNSRFFGHNLTASIWHDGSKDQDQKFVVRRSSFDGVPGFPLGRNNRDGQFFLLDNRFSASMADKPIYRPSAESAYQWPARNYYWNNRRDAGNFAWFADNLDQAAGAPRARDITAAWTFQGRWDPEETMPAVLPFASTPRPEHGDRDAPAALTVLRWAGARDATKYKVAFGTSTPPISRTEMNDTRYEVGRLTPGTTYYWRVDTVTPAGVIAGPVWSFRAAARELRLPASSVGQKPRTAAPKAAGSAMPPAASAVQQPVTAAPKGASLAKPPTWRVRIVLVGDSTVTDEVGWGLGFKRRLADRADCINLARNGRSSKSFVDEGHWGQALEARADYVLIQFGHNDMPGKGPERETDPKTTYRTYLARYVDQARAAGTIPIIVTSLTRRLFGQDGRIHSDLGDYVAAAKTIAAEKGVAVIDLHARSVELLDRMGPAAAAAFNIAKADNTPDMTHLSKQASTAFGAIVADELMRLVPALEPYLSQPAPPVAWNACLTQPAAWYRSADAVRIADNVLLYQRRTGGWPKNIDMARVLAPVDVATIGDERELNDSTIDNSSTHTQLRYLARVFEATKQMRFSDSFGVGLAYLFEAQYPNGGWPQYYPLRANYSRYITFNDDAMIGVMRLLREIGDARAPFGFVDEATRARARAAVQRGIGLIVKSQIRVGGTLTAWCAQHDEQTLEPRDARTYEHASISGRESVEILRFLMGIERPGADVIAAIEGAVAYLRNNQVRGLRLVEKPDPALPHGRDVVAEADLSAPPLWARFYQIGTNRPIYSGRDGVIRFNLSEIEVERRAGYSWLGPYAADLLDREYPAWRARQK